MSKKPQSIHLMGICGTGMGSFAGLLKTAGHDVRGSDQNVYPPMSTKLASWGIEVREGYGPSNLEPRPDLVVVGNVIRRTNPEAEALVAQGIEYTSFPKALSDLFLTGKHSVVVSGTHGKTTTASMIAWVLTAAGRDPSMLVGGVPGNFGEGFRLGRGEHFVVEGDEYDTAYFDKVPKFLHYQPRSLIITSLEFDHADIYDDVESIECEFEKVVGLVPSDGKIYVCASAERAVRQTVGAKANVESYTASGDRATWQACDIETTDAGSSFSLFNGRIRVGRLSIPLAGRHNVENTTVAAAFLLSAGLSVAEIREGLESFEGVARRQTVRATIDGVRIIDDFAHHPTAVRETVAAVRARYPDGKLFAIFEPRTATSSRKFFQDAYATAFAGANQTIIAAVGRRELNENERLDARTLVAGIRADGHQARHIPEVKDIVATLAREAQPTDTLLFMSNGGFGGIYEQIENALRNR